MTQKITETRHFQENVKRSRDRYAKKYSDVGMAVGSKGRDDIWHINTKLNIRFILLVLQVCSVTGIVVGDHLISPLQVMLRNSLQEALFIGQTCFEQLGLRQCHAGPGICIRLTVVANKDV